MTSNSGYSGIEGGEHLGTSRPRQRNDKIEVDGMIMSSPG